jgi:hypothetical protein
MTPLADPGCTLPFCIAPRAVSPAGYASRTRAGNGRPGDRSQPHRGSRTFRDIVYHLGGWAARLRSIWELCASAGRNVSIVSSDRVTSNAVPKVAIVTNSRTVPS